jgi:acetyltransferase-like isoleucine patch superfamily enzyme
MGYREMRPSIKALIQIFCFGLPWQIRRRILQMAFGYKLDRSARIGFSIILADAAVLKAKAAIGHFNYIGRLDKLVICEEGLINRYNWITGASRLEESPFFKGKESRKSELIVGKGAAIENWHLIDCTDAVEFGDFAILAGYRSKIITHGADVIRSKLVCSPVLIGSYSMLAAGVTIMKGVTIAPCCIAGADSVVTKSIKEPYTMVAGNPAEFVRKLPQTAKLFTRTESVIY